MPRLFDKPWAELDAKSVEAFLSEATDEGLTWEAKGVSEPHRDSIRKAVCGFANAMGGYLIIGAERAEDGWLLRGIEFRHEEPATWLTSVIADGGVSPVPRFDVKVFARDDARKAAVISVEPVTAPPCITSSGIVYQRVSGQTLPVTDQRVLADLVKAGDAARQGAEAVALRAARRMLAEPVDFGPEASVFAVALSAVGGPADKAGVLFSERFSDELVKLVSERLQTDGNFPAKSSVRQDSVRASSSSPQFGYGITAAGFWDGSVAVVQSKPGGTTLVPDLSQDIQRSWRALAVAAELLAGTGDAHLVVLVNAEHPGLASASRDVPRAPIQRWTEVREPTSDELGSVERELQRGFGRARWEPAGAADGDL
jgi:hypothetical protein